MAPEQPFASQGLPACDAVCLSMDVDCGVGDVVDGANRVVGIEDAFIDPVFREMLPRFLDEIEDLGIRMTFFIIAATVDTAERRAILRRMTERGHEVASHSLTHPKAFGDLDGPDLHRELAQSKAVLEDAAGAAIEGFRAPGFFVDDRVLAAVEAAGYRYSSSINSSVLYNLSKMAFLLREKLSFINPVTSYYIEPRSLLAPRFPYRPQPTAFWRRCPDRDLVELPISMGLFRLLPGVTFASDAMLPLGIGTRFIAGLIHRLPFANIVIHDFEYLLASDFAPGTPIPRSTALTWAMPRDRKTAHLHSVLQSGRQSLPLREMVRQHASARLIGVPVQELERSEVQLLRDGSPPAEPEIDQVKR
ncbi:MAG: hypothetical protein EPN20_15455 [Magnetospirillum sp.]|nr:MAG: hypothetical protein EPN20_15455 [Magnetospirillum sp.]